MSEISEKKELVARLRAIAEQVAIANRMSYQTFLETAEELERQIDDEETERG